MLGFQALSESPLSSLPSESLRVDAATLTPSAQLVAGEHAVNSDPVSLTPVGQAIGLIVGVVMSVAAAAITPAPQDVTLTAPAAQILAVTQASITPAGQAVAAEHTNTADVAEITPAGQSVALVQGSVLPVDRAALTPAGQTVNLTPGGPLSNFTLTVTQATPTTAGSTVAGIATESAAPIQITAAGQEVFIGFGGADPVLAVTQASITPTGYDVDYLDERTFDQAQVTAGGQDVTLSATRQFVVTAVTLTPSAQSAVLRLLVPVASTAMTPARSNVATNVAWTFTQASASGQGQTVGLIADTGERLTVEPVTFTPQRYDAALPITGGVTQASVQPVPQTVPVNYGGPVTAASVTPARSNIDVTIKVPLSAVTVSGQGKDISLQQSIGGTLQVTRAQVTPALQAVSLYGPGQQFVSVSPALVSPAGQAVSLISSALITGGVDEFTLIAPRRDYTLADDRAPWELIAARRNLTVDA